MSPRRPGAALAGALVALTLAACGSPDTPAGPAGDSAITIVTSTNVYGSIARSVGGDRVNVESLITDPAADPHSYESTPSDAVKVAGADVVIYNGGGYDDWMAQLVESAGAGDRVVIDVADLSGFFADPTATGSGVNEHLWYSLPTVAKLVQRLSDDLADADPANKLEYAAGAQSSLLEISGLVSRIGSTIRDAHRGERIALTEPVAGYLVEAAGLTDATPEAFSEAIEEDTDPPAAVLQETLALFGADPVRALILNAQTETPTTDQVQQAAQTARVPVVDVTETLPEGTDDYVTWMGAQIDALSAALDRA